MFFFPASPSPSPPGRLEHSAGVLVKLDDGLAVAFGRHEEQCGDLKLFV